MNSLFRGATPTAFLILVFSAACIAQTTAITYQGQLNNSALPANGNYEMQFKLFDALAGGAQVGPTVTHASIAVSNGSFSVTLDFLAPAFAGGAARYLEISVRPTGNPNPITLLSPRQEVKSVPFAIQSKNSTTADAATNSQQLGGIVATEYVTTSSVGNTFIKNGTVLQPTSNFNISGNGTVAGVLTANTVTSQTGTGFYGVRQTDGATTIGTYVGNGFGASGGWLGTQTNSPLHFFTNNGQARMTIDTAGNVGIGTFTPIAGYKLDVNGGVVMRTGGTGGIMAFGSPSAETGLTISSTHRADIRFDGNTLKLLAGSGVGPMPTTSGINIDRAGNVGIGTTAPTSKLEIVAQDGLAITGFQPFITLRDTSASNQRGIIQTAAGSIVFYPNSFIGGAPPMVINNGSGTTQIRVLQITGGSDLAENFELGEEVLPGMVVAIDPKNAGRLMLARGAYNRAVAGVLSGANNLSPGLLLPDLNKSSNSNPVALSGRVWVYADATRYAITPGNLLTTSSTAGHAMKVTNHRRAQGAIIGKAMTSLESGKGLVLVLVSLQ